MRTLEELLAGRGETLIRHFVRLMAEGGKNTESEGTPLLNPRSAATVLGSLIYMTGRLYFSELDAGDPEAGKTLSALHTFIGWQNDIACHTWGKRSILLCLDLFRQREVLSLFGADELLLLRQKTDVSDFFDCEKLVLIGMSNNYFELALFLLELRAKLGWESDALCERVREHWQSTLSEETDSGYMDDCPPYGRFDSYTFMPVFSAPSRAGNAGRAMTTQEARQLRESADWFLAMANTHGDGFCYGRSLSVYGDRKAISVLNTLLAFGIVREGETERILSYLCALYEKFMTFWMDDDRGSLNLWWDGRGTDDYREVHRALEVNLEFGGNFMDDLALYRRLGLADKKPAPLPHPASWEISPLTFRLKPNLARVFVLRKGDLLLMLPFVGGGNLHSFSQYMAFPASCRYSEVSAQSRLPVFIPEYISEDGVRMRPFQFWDKAECETKNGVPVISASGTLTAVDLTSPKWSGNPADTGIRFRAKYTFEEDTVRVSFEADGTFASVRMVIAENTYGTQFEVWGFSDSMSAEHTEADLKAPHGALRLTEYTRIGNAPVGYSIKYPKSAFEADILISGGTPAKGATLC